MVPLRRPTPPDQVVSNARDAQLGVGLVVSFAIIAAITSRSLGLASGGSLVAMLVISGALLLVALGLGWAMRPGPAAQRDVLVFPLLVFAGEVTIAVFTDGVAQTYSGYFALAVMYVGLTQPRVMTSVCVAVAAPCWLLCQERLDPSTFVRLAIIGTVWWLLGTTLASRVSRDRAQATLLSQRANTDALTGLSSRLSLTQEIDDVIARRSAADGGASVMLIDLDGFKGVNDMFGHAAGDELLVMLAARIRSTVRPGDVCARLGGDEFAVLLRHADRSQAVNVAKRLIARLAEPVMLTRGRMAVTASVGVASVDDAANATEVLRDADLAMYDAKTAGRNRVSSFERELGVRRTARLQLEAELHEALARDEFELYYQPVVHLQTGNVIGAEALLRWNHPSRGLLAPGEFLSTSEEIGVIVALGDWIVDEACRQAIRWQPEDSSQAMTMAVNLSAPELLAPDFTSRLVHTLETSGLPPALLVLEVSERLVVSDAPLIKARIHELRELGVRIAIDDFGTGHSSLAYLRELPVDILKIDRSFVQSVGTDPQATALVKSIVAIADALHLGTIAEGVETAEQADVLRDLGCEIAQGYRFSRPEPAALLDEQRRARQA